MTSRQSNQRIFVGLASGGLLFAGALLFCFNYGKAPNSNAPVNDPQVTPMLAPPSNQLLKQLQTLTQASAAIANADNALAAGQKIMVDEASHETLLSIDETGATDVSWQLAPQSERVPGIPLDKNIQAYSIVILNHRPSAFPSQGDKVTLPMFDGRALAANVETVKTMTNGDRIWTGHLDGYGDDYSVVMTYGDDLTFATINTPDGNYSLEAKEGVGWLYKNPRIIDLVGAHSTDFLVRDVN